MKKIPVFLKTFLISKSFFITFLNFLFLIFFTTLCFSAPEYSVRLDKDRVSAGKTLSVILEIFWQGTADDFMVVPPSPSFPEKTEQVSSSFSSSTTENSYHLIYEYILRVSEEGEYKIGPIEIKYWSKGEDKESTLLTNEISFEVKKNSYISSSFTFVLLSILLIIFIIVLYVFIRDKKFLKKKEGGTGADLPGKDEIIKTYNACKKCRTEGDYAGFYRAAIDVLEKTSIEESIIIDDLKSVCEKVEFGSYVPASEEIEPVFRRITKAMEKNFSDKTDCELEYKKYCKLCVFRAHRRSSRLFKAPVLGRAKAGLSLHFRVE